LEETPSAETGGGLPFVGSKSTSRGGSTGESRGTEGEPPGLGSQVVHIISAVDRTIPEIERNKTGKKYEGRIC